MKRSLPNRSTILGLGFMGVALASGCPMYSEYHSGGCYYANDCPFGYQCRSDGRCVESPPHIGTGGQDGGSSDGRTDARADVATADATADVSIVDSGTPDAATGTDVRSTDSSAMDASGETSPSDAAGPVYCGNPSDCAAAETCSTDGTCHSGNCSTNACINQFQCAITANGPACVHGDSRACGADHQCLVTERCIEGMCAPVAELCTDRSQCSASKVCVEGRCTAACTADSQCAQGFTCRLALGVCNVKARTCTRTSDCAGKDSVCVDGACVPRCNARGACEGGSGVCVDNGCVPTAKVAAECDTSAGCPMDSICLHRNCYVSCASPNPTACATLPGTPVCKTITVAAMSYSVCGTADTLGPDCDLSANRPCPAGATCIDGFCR